MELPKNSTVLFFSPHPDDESISAGALLYDLVKLNNHVIVYFLANSPKGVAGDISDADKINIRQDEGRAGCNVLGAVAKFLNLDNPTLEVTDENVATLQNIITEADPRLVITTSVYEAHPTHRKTTELVNAAMKGSAIPLWYGEVWSPVTRPQYVHFFDESTMKVKQAALSEYKSQIKRTNWVEASRGLNIYRAMTGKEVVGDFGSTKSDFAPFAEVFEIKGSSDS